jgi:hypothetical protein
MLARASSLRARVGMAVDVVGLFMALLFRGISTPSLSAQGEQRRSAFFNIRRDIGRRSKVLHGESDSAANDEQRQRVSQAISDACMSESGGDSDSRKALGKWRRIPAKQTMAARQAPTANHAVSAR